MKKPFILLTAVLMLTSCQDSILQMDAPTTNQNTEAPKPGMQRLVVSSQMELQRLLAEVAETSTPLRRSKVPGEVSNNEEPWMSLIEANRQKVMASLTPEQLDSIANDEEELEFCPVDSIIADIQFAQLLNAEREIQYENTVYRYLRNGVAYADAEYAEELKTVEILTNDFKVTPENEGIPRLITQHGFFRPVQYEVVEFDTEASEGDDSGTEGSGSGYGFDPTGEEDFYQNSPSIVALTLSNGVQIPIQDIRDINYKFSNDGNWFHKFWTNRWGKNVVALKKFSNERRKVNLNFYQQNYVIYNVIGTNLKMQKFVCGIWWNIKADEMFQGWETVTIKYTMPQPPINKFKNPLNGANEYPTYALRPLPLGKENGLILTIPYENYNYNNRDLKAEYNSGINSMWINASDDCKRIINNDIKKAGLISYEGKDIYLTYGPQSKSWMNHKSENTKFYSKWKGSIPFTFSHENLTATASIDLGMSDKAILYRGIVYGAIKYKGEWRAARITKDRD